jgi:hypothetical protein
MVGNGVTKSDSPNRGSVNKEEHFSTLRGGEIQKRPYLLRKRLKMNDISGLRLMSLNGVADAYLLLNWSAGGVRATDPTPCEET